MHESPLDKWEALLREGLVEPPADFHCRLMARVAEVAQVPQPPSSAHNRHNWLHTIFQGLAVLGAATAGLASLSQLAIFGFGIWSATAAG